MCILEKNEHSDANLLNGFTILRFAHAYESGGGVEQHLEYLDRTLLERNKLTVLRMYLSDRFNLARQQSYIGKGKLIKIPLRIERTARATDASNQKIIEFKATFLKNIVRDRVLYNPILYRLVFQKIISKLPRRHSAVEALNAKQETFWIFDNFKIDIVVLHHQGGADSSAIIDVAKAYSTPYIIMNHFSNERLKDMSVRSQITHAAGVAGVTSIGVPKIFKKNFVNLSNGIDMNLFNPVKAIPVRSNTVEKIVILPARIVPTKGQSDLIRSCAILKERGIPIKISLAGRSDSPLYENRLKSEAIELGLFDDISFLGELGIEQLRDLYALSDVLAFPTYHHEGLPRILIEAQAMKLPVIAYNVGGTSEAMIHGRTGYLISKGDIKEFTEKLGELLIDERKRRQMGIEGRRFVQDRFSLNALARRHEEYYLKIIKGAR